MKTSDSVATGDDVVDCLHEAWVQLKLFDDVHSDICRWFADFIVHWAVLLCVTDFSFNIYQSWEQKKNHVPA